MATLAAYWKLDETGGPVIADSADAHIGLLTGSPVATRIPGIVSPVALNFTGGTGRVTFSDTAALDFPAGLTFAVWVRLAPATAPGKNFFGKVDIGTGNGFAFGFGPGVAPTSFTLTVINLGIVQVPQLLSPPGVDDGRWHHLAAVYTGTRWKFYFKGILMGTMAPSPYPIPDAGQWWIGTLLAPLMPFFGDLDDARIYDGVLTDAQIKTLATGDAPPGAIWSPGRDFIREGVKVGMLVTTSTTFGAANIIEVRPEVLVLDVPQVPGEIAYNISGAILEAAAPGPVPGLPLVQAI